MNIKIVFSILLFIGLLSIIGYITGNLLLEVNLNKECFTIDNLTADECQKIYNYYCTPDCTFRQANIPDVEDKTVRGPCEVCLWIQNDSKYNKNYYVLIKTANFLENQYNPSLKLCRESPQAAPNTYWVISDNLLVCILKDFYPEISGISNQVCDEIKKLAEEHNLPTNSEGLPVSYKHEVIIGEIVYSPIHIIGGPKTCNIYTLEDNSYGIKTEICNGSLMYDWEEYADLLLYAALSHHYNNIKNNGTDFGAIAKSKSIESYNKAKNMWDGVGLNDKVRQNNGLYATYKLSLLVYASKMLNQPLEFADEILARIILQQREDGGIITDYNSEGEPIGDANVETTALTIMAFSAFQAKSF